MHAPKIILVGADKGGVGKTTVTRILIERAIQFGGKPRVIDTEPSPGVLRRFYPDAELIDVRTVAGQMAVMDNPRPLTIVDVRAGLLLLVLRSLRDAGLLVDAKNGQVRFTITHVMGVTHASYSEISPAKEIIGIAGEGASHILVKNYDKPDLKFEWNSIVAPTITIPNLDPLAAAAIDNENVMPEAFSMDQTKSRTLRGYTRHWLHHIYPEFKRVGLDDELRP